MSGFKIHHKPKVVNTTWLGINAESSSKKQNNIKFEEM